MAKKKSTPKTKGVSYHIKKGPDGKPRLNADGSLSILTLVRVGRFKPTSRTFKTMEAAEAWGKALVDDLKEQGQRDVSPDITSLTIDQLLNAYLAAPEVSSLKRFDAYADWAHWWKREYAGTKVLEFGLKSIHEARGKLNQTRGRLTGRKWSAITVNRHLSLMRGAWNWGRNSGWIPLERVWPQKVMLSEKARIRFLSPDELDALLASVENDQVMKAAILVAISTGIRQGELLGLKWSDINFVKAHLTLLETKTDVPRRVHIPATAIAALEGLKARKVVNPVWVFLSRDGTRLNKNTLTARWNDVRQRAKLQDFRWHDLRHTCASYLAQNGSTLLEIGGVLGHKSPSMTAKYAHLVQGAPVTGHAALDGMLRGK
jgi:integrase